MEDDFVQISEDGLHFQVADRPFFFAGANCYYFLTRGADPNLQHQVLQVLDAAKNLGLSVIRTWAFCDGEEWNALQPSPGTFNEQVFQSLDWLLVEARRRQLRLILALTNYWAAYGGMRQYVKWSCQRRSLPESDKAESFYTDNCCQDIFQNFLATITNRVNSFTGLAYRDDATILSWELANEPRCDGDFSGSVLSNWIEVTAEFLKSLDPKHLVCVGTEGFLGSSTPDCIPDNPYDCMSQGCDFLRNQSCKGIDFATVHLWPDVWMGDASEERKLAFSQRWIHCHVDLCSRVLRKPLVITEFGKKPRGKPRAAFYDLVCSSVLRHARAGQGLVGSCWWAAAHQGYPDYDGFTVYPDPQSPPSASQQGPASVADAPSSQDNSSSAATLERGASGASPVQECPTGLADLPARDVIQQGRPVYKDADTLSVIKQHAAAMLELCSAAESHCLLM